MRTTSFRPLLFLAAGTLAAAAPARAQGTPADQEALRRRGTEYAAAWARGDAAAVAAFYLPNALEVGADGTARSGRAAVERGLAQQFAGPFKGTTIAITSEPSTFVKPDVAIGRGTYEVRREGEVVAAGRYMNVWVKGAAGWRLRANQTLVPVQTTASAGATTGGAPARALTLDQIAGRWQMRVMLESGDSTLVVHELAVTPDRGGWTMTFPNRAPLPVRVVALEGDSVITEVGPYQSVLRSGNVPVTTRGVYRLRGGRLVGTTIARYAGAGADSVLRVRSVGTRVP